MNGILIIDKPQGMTSHDVVSFMRRKTGIRRIGHSGTLDPMATGVLPVFIGRATRIIEYVGLYTGNEAKKYRCTMRLGLSTDTLDIWGTKIFGESTLKVNPKTISYDEIMRVLKAFEGESEQKPPMYSAVKIGGRKLYEYARAGKSVDEELIRARPININQIDVKEYEAETCEVIFDITCSKGVYVRTICHEAGQSLGCGAVMSGLTRLTSDGFSIEKAIPISALEDVGETIETFLMPIEDALACMPRAVVDEKGSADFLNGRETKEGTHSLPEGTAICVYGPAGFLGIGLSVSGIIKPHKVMK